MYNTLVLIIEVLATKSLEYSEQIMTNRLLGQDLPLELHTGFLPPLSGILSSPFRYPVPKLFFLYLNRDICDIIMNGQRNYYLLTHNFTVKIQISWFQGNFFLSIIPPTVDYYMTDSLKPNPIIQFYRYFLSAYCVLVHLLVAGEQIKISKSLRNAASPTREKCRQ